MIGISMMVFMAKSPNDEGLWESVIFIRPKCDLERWHELGLGFKGSQVRRG